MTLAGLLLCLAAIAIYTLGFTALYRETEDAITYKVVSVIFLLCGIAVLSL